MLDIDQNSFEAFGKRLPDVQGYQPCRQVGRIVAEGIAVGWAESARRFKLGARHNTPAGRAAACVVPALVWVVVDDLGRSWGGHDRRRLYRWEEGVVVLVGVVGVAGVALLVVVVVLLFAGVCDCWPVTKSWLVHCRQETIGGSSIGRRWVASSASEWKDRGGR